MELTNAYVILAWLLTSCLEFLLRLLHRAKKYRIKPALSNITTTD